MSIRNYPKYQRPWDVRTSLWARFSLTPVPFIVRVMGAHGQDPGFAGMTLLSSCRFLMSFEPRIKYGVDSSRNPEDAATGSGTIRIHCRIFEIADLMNP
jgi:hypothetical protein